MDNKIICFYCKYQKSMLKVGPGGEGDRIDFIWLSHIIAHLQCLGCTSRKSRDPPSSKIAGTLGCSFIPPKNMVSCRFWSIPMFISMSITPPIYTLYRCGNSWKHTTHAGTADRDAECESTLPAKSWLLQSWCVYFPTWLWLGQKPWCPGKHPMRRWRLRAVPVI